MKHDFGDILTADEFRVMWVKPEHSAEDIHKLLVSHAALLNKVKWLESGPHDYERRLRHALLELSDAAIALDDQWVELGSYETAGVDTFLERFLEAVAHVRAIRGISGVRS